MGDVVRALRAERAVVLTAPTGSGKTTRIAPALLDALPGEVLLLEPRRIAARAAARRIASERGVALGGEVGFATAEETKVGHDTRLIAATYGVFLARVTRDPLLEGVGAVLFDEFHERSVEQDLCLALAQKVRAELRPDLALVCMSATLDPAPVAAFLEPAEVLQSEGRSYPVELRRTPARPREREEDTLERALREHPDPAGGDTLVFVAGVGEIRRAARKLQGYAKAEGLEIAELYGDLPAAKQDALFEPGARSRLILATNVAESSITLPRVTRVVDSGAVRRLEHDPASGLDALVLGRASLSSAEQRRGRAGRTGPGLCVRTWSEAEDRARAGLERPEIERVELSRAVLALLAFGEPDPLEFRWYEAPQEERLMAAVALLEELGAIAAGRLTPLGKRMASLPAAPRLARLALEAAKLGEPERGALAAALLSERDPLRDVNFGASAAESDLLLRVEALEHGGVGDQRGVAAVERSARRLLRALPKAGGSRGSRATADEALLRAVFSAYPDRLARRRAPGDARAVLRGGRGLELARTSRVREAELFCALDLDGAGAGANALCRMASAVQREWLEEEGIEERLAVRFDAEAERVVGRAELRWRDFVLEDREHGGVDAVAAGEALLEAALGDPARALDLRGRDAERLLTRLACLAEWRPELEVPDFSGAEGLRPALEVLCADRRSFAELRKAPLAATIKGLLAPKIGRALSSDCPETVQVPSGSRIVIQYQPGEPPVLAARIQELFGLAETPKVGGGRVALVLHLLAPNRRPQQVTTDLKSFWNGTYHDVRKELRRRYPKHAWPEDPWNAPAERRPGRRPH